MDISEDILERALVGQLNYLHGLRERSRADLRRKYERSFKRSRFYVKFTNDIPREWIEQRMFYAYCLKYPCYKPGSKMLVAFRKKAKEVLLSPPPNKPQGELRERMHNRVLFTRHNIAKLPEHEVDGYLTLLGYNVEGSLPQKKQALWEAYSKRSSDLPPVFDNMGKYKRIRRKGHSHNNTYVLVDVILRYPKMGWVEFEEVFGDLMPDVTPNSFRWTRSYCRRQYGTQFVPHLKSGPRRAVTKGRAAYDSALRVTPEKPNFSDPLVDEIFKDDAEDYQT